jgi:hypothetical protein
MAKGRWYQKISRHQALFAPRASLALSILLAVVPAWGAAERARTNVVERPRGLFILDSREGTSYRDGTLRDANLRDYPFVDGYVLRASWASMEPAPGQFDFKIIDHILARLPKGQRLSLILHSPDPADIAATAGVATWQDQERRGAKKNYARAVPWDPVLRERRHAFIAALAGHKTEGVALRDNPVLVAVNPFLPGGHTGIRDPNVARFRDLPGYSRAKLLAAVQDELRLLTREFLRTFVQIGCWKVQDNQPGREAWEEIRAAVMAEFNATASPRVGFFMENLAASRPAPGQDPVSGYPNTEFGAPLFRSRDRTWIAFQALTCWLRPFTGAPKVAHGTPADGMQYAHDTYGCVYFEHYLPDIENPAWRGDFQKWHELLRSRTSARAGGETR